MRNAFRAYILPSDEEFKALWKEAIFSFDASVLLNIYGYSESTREDLLALLERLSERVRLPHQFGLEFMRDRVRVISKQIGNYRRVEEQLQKTRDENFSPKSEHPFPSKKSLRAYEALLKELAADRLKMERLITDDIHGRRLIQIFDGRVGSEPSAEKLNVLHAEAKARYQKENSPRLFIQRLRRLVSTN